ncbi:MAG: DegT/DnrJ/EryC1/StrS family aminotransferase [Opitutales bacterium]|jgi:perosamine synthetase|nr:DegT/DnrJ/EryC1/StrS family aminotransferase [Opitutales bacterium]
MKNRWTERIPVMSPSLTELESKYVQNSLDSTWIGGEGAYIDQMERDWADICGVSHAVMTANGTLAITLALQVIGVGAGDEVIVPALTYAATANSVRLVGGEPVFVDVEEDTWCMDSTLVESAITPRTRAIIPVDLFGHPTDIDPITEIANAHGIHVIIDAAQSHLATYKKRPVGSLAQMTTFSFHVGKMFTSGEGGAVTTDDAELAGKLRLIRGHGMDPNRRFFHPVVGTNNRMTNLQAAMLCAQIERRDEIVARRRATFQAYANGLSGIPGLSLRPVADWATASPWVFCLRLSESEFGMSRDDLIEELSGRNIETRPFYYPLHRLPMYRELSESRGESCPVSDSLSSEGMFLPSSTDISADELGFIIETVRSISSKRSGS